MSVSKNIYQKFASPGALLSKLQSNLVQAGPGDESGEAEGLETYLGSLIPVQNEVLKPVENRGEKEKNGKE